MASEHRTPPVPSSDGGLGLRSKAAILAGRAVAGASKLANLGTGSVIGGRVSLALDHELLARLAGGRQVALVSATNGKTTMTHLLATALRRHGPVATNDLGANMPPGIVAALGVADPGARAVLEVDERWLPAVLEATGPATVVLGNLSRDQLDRSHEVRATAETWREALGRLPVEHVVANVDDPLVVWAAGSCDPDRVVWVGTAAHWTLDAAGCPSCGGRIEFDEDGRSWRCGTCAFARPTPSWQLEGPGAGSATARVLGPAGPTDLRLALPGRVNAANATLVLAAATAMGADPARVAGALATVNEVAGRYKTAEVAGTPVRMLLAKNPAGWQEAIEMLAPPPQPVLAAINARIADGRDPSWLWDVPYERLAGRFVVALGERRHDLAVRLAYAGVAHDVAGSLAEGVERALDGAAEAGVTASRVDLIANYTAFQDYLDEVGREATAATALDAGGDAHGDDGADRSGEGGDTGG